MSSLLTGGGSDSMDNDASEAQSMSLLGVAGQPESKPDTGEAFGLESPSEGNRLLSQTPVVLGALAVVAVVALLGMRWMQGDVSERSATTAAIEAKIDNYLASLTNASQMDPDDPRRPENMRQMVAGADEMIRVLNTNNVSHQVPVEYVKKNPFVLWLPEAKEPEDDGPDQSAEDAARRLAALRSEIKRYRIDSVMDGPRPVAVINGEFYRKGDELGSFVIYSIDRRAVKFRAGKRLFVITIEQGS